MLGGGAVEDRWTQIESGGTILARLSWVLRTRLAPATLFSSIEGSGNPDSSLRAGS